MKETQWISERFHHAIDHSMKHLDTVPPAVAQAGIQCSDCLLNEGTIWCVGNSIHGLIAQYFTTRLLSTYRHSRPGLPAVCLSQEGATLTAIYHEGGAAEIYGRQLRALGRPGDVLLLVHGEGVGSADQRALKAAHAQQMSAITLGARDTDLGALLQANDTEIQLDTEDNARACELQMLIANCLCEFIDYRIFGYDN